MAPPNGRFVPDPPGDDDDRFARSFKNWREWNVAVNFLVNLHIGVDDADVQCLKVDPPDVAYRDALFEIKEIMDPGRRRHDEVKAAQRHVDANGGKAETVMYTAEDLTPSDVATLVLAELDRLDQKHYLLDQRAKIDLLFYVNKLDHWFEDGPMPDPKQFDDHGWRSVSAVVDTQQSMVFSARPDAPDFLVENIGVVRKLWEPLGDED